MNPTHPSEIEDWTIMSPNERQNGIITWRNEVKKIIERERRKLANPIISFNWNFKPELLKKFIKPVPKSKLEKILNPGKNLNYD